MTKYHLQINCLRLCLLLTVFIEQIICDRVVRERPYPFITVRKNLGTIPCILYKLSLLKKLNITLDFFIQYYLTNL